MNNTNKTIISLLVANLTATIWFGVKDNDIPQNQNSHGQVSNHQLPELITATVKSELLDTFITHFNAKNYDALYEMFGPTAKAQVDKEVAKKEFIKLTALFHGIKNGTFSFSEFAAQQGNATFYILNYTVKLSEQGDFGVTGDLKITIAIEGDQYQIYGIHLNGRL
ncbi:hypothetical protein HWV00_11475 [Moritella sp. 24]|uniref:hypothetical protein n=1 Tax=Moritella sp. 24 TaxID=2746230 RepID=UPI001BAA546B|nr:hypothetical protein [Moritella sp. 24]QUM76805.1 hypothetical protein HWV00_11475 [Moritella sp. 24]